MAPPGMAGLFRSEGVVFRDPDPTCTMGARGIVPIHSFSRDALMACVGGVVGLLGVLVLVAGTVMGPYHHYCKVLSPQPVIECLIYSSTDSTARMEQVEYIIAKSITRTGAVSLKDWNKNWHDHAQEIATGRVQVLDLPPDQAKAVAQLVATTDGIIFDLWAPGDRVPSGKVIIAQSVGHVDLTEVEFKQGATPTN